MFSLSFSPAGSHTPYLLFLKHSSPLHLFLLLCLDDLCSSFDVELKVCFFWSAEPWHPRFGLGTFLRAPVQGLAQVLGLTYRCNWTLLNLLLLCFIIEPAKHQYKIKDSSKWIIPFRAAPKVSMAYIVLRA